MPVGVWSIVLAASGAFDILTDIYVFVLWVFFGMSAAVLFVETVLVRSHSRGSFYMPKELYAPARRLRLRKPSPTLRTDLESKASAAPSSPNPLLRYRDIDVL